jgi:hypothetical protein
MMSMLLDRRETGRRGVDASMIATTSFAHALPVNGHEPSEFSTCWCSFGHIFVTSRYCVENSGISA